MACSEEISCEDAKLGDGQLFRKILRKVGDCFAIAITGSVTTTAASSYRTTTRTKDAASTGVQTITPGKKRVVIETSEDFTGNILGTEAYPSRAYDFPILQNDDMHGAISYERTGGYVIVTETT